MRPLLLRFAALAITLGAIGCADSRTTQPSDLESSFALAPGQQADFIDRIKSLIKVLFVAPDQVERLEDFGRIRRAVARGDVPGAKAGLVAFVSSILQAYPGVQPPTTAAQLRELINRTSRLVGLPVPLPGANPFAGDGAVAVVGAAGGVVVTSSRFGGVAISAGALTTDVIVVVERLPNPTTPGAGPLPTTLRQLPLFYRFSTVPAVAQFAVPVTVAACQLEVGDPFGPASQAEANRLQLAQPDPSDPTGVALLPRVAAPFLDCDGITLSAARFDAGDQSLLARALGLVGRGSTEVLDLFRPSVAHAIHGGLGGTTSSPGTFGAVVPGGVTPEHWILAVGGLHTCILDLGGTTSCWGDNSSGQVGTGGARIGGNPRTSVAGNPAFTSVATNGSYTCGRAAAATDLCWGREPDPFGPANATLVPTPLGHGPYLQVSPSLLAACALTPSSSAVCWGINQLGEVGDGTQTNRPAPVLVSTSLAFQQIESSWIKTCALAIGGEAYCWGRWQGQLFPTQDLTPVPVPGGHVFRRLYAGGTSTCGITTTDETWCWGDNASGQLGSGAAGPAAGTPVQVQGGHVFVMIATGKTPNNGGSGFTCGLTNAGQVLCWGQNDQGQLGDGTTADHLLPAPILSSEVFVAVGAGYRFACAMTVDRRVFCWGSNAAGELGSGTAGGFSAVPVLVP